MSICWEDLVSIICASVCAKNISSLYGVDLKEKWHPVGGKGFDHCRALSFWSFLILFYVTAWHLSLECCQTISSLSFYYMEVSLLKTRMLMLLQLLSAWVCVCVCVCVLSINILVYGAWMEGWNFILIHSLTLCPATQMLWNRQK